MKSLEHKELVVERICAEGCQFVNQLLVSADIQLSHEPFQQLNKVVQNWVLVELSSVMNVYENSGSCSI